MATALTISGRRVFNPGEQKNGPRHVPRSPSTTPISYPTIAYSSPLHSSVCIDEWTRDLWCISYPHRKYKIPLELKWNKYTTHQHKVAFGLMNGQLLVLDFTDVADP